MGVGTLTIYSASAGSGKTHRLAGFYLEKLFRSRFSYQKILAVTFTHKATAEMKGRILEELKKLADGSDSKYLGELLQSTGKSEEALRKEAGEILYSVLHDFSRFSVSTIDGFYQKIIRAFARDIGLHSGFSTEIDHSAILASAVDKLIDSAATDNIMRNWLSTYASSNIEEGKTWDLRQNIIELSGELFNEKFKLLSPSEKKKLQDKEFMKSYIREIKSIQAAFSNNMKRIGLICTGIFDRYDLTDDMFFQKGRGIPSFVNAIAKGEFKSPNAYVRTATGSSPKWSSGVMDEALIEAVKNGLAEYVREAVNYFDDNIRFYKTAKEIGTNIYILGILSDVMNQVHTLTRNDNIFLLSDAGELISLITEKDQAPFIYEKAGNTFENFMIDEFQDTSVIQWKNFRHLIDNSMAQGFDNLVVGDIKQSIYRWRNGDWKTLSDLKKEVDNERYFSRSLDTNWRSSANIIRFNNSLFSIIPYQIDKEISENKPSASFRELYSETRQIDPGLKGNGYVRIEFIDNNDEAGWQEIVLQRIPSVIELIQDKGFKASDIGILVRDNKEGTRLLKEIIDYSRSCPDENRKRYNYNVVSSESLLLSNSPAINFIVSVLMVIDNPENMIGRALMLRNYLLSGGKQDADQVLLDSADLIEYSGGFFPPGYKEFLEGIRYLPLWNVTEEIIKFFGLGNYSYNVAYLDSFQDIVLNFMSSANPAISAFLEWWESDGIKKSVLLPEQQDSMKILTIHKSKGLEFKVVILPFLSWNVDHKSSHSNIMWVTPGSPPYNKLGILPVRYKSDLADTIFADQYFKEKYSAYLDNINLLYVAFTRAVHAIFGFAPDKPAPGNRIAAVVKNALNYSEDIDGAEDNFLYRHFDPLTKVFEYGTIEEIKEAKDTIDRLDVSSYPVNENSGSLKLKLHWENYLSSDKSGVRKRINYGRMMHEIFSEINTSDDINEAVRKRVLEGKIPEAEEKGLAEKINGLVERPLIRSWFDKGNEVLNEASILMPDSLVKRPDRIILKEGHATIIDFKFGVENQSYLNQISQYKRIITEMGYSVSTAYLWYVDADKIISV